jgi:glycosyltransferase involved in cell wall biosynthesis
MRKICYLGHADSNYMIEWANYFAQIEWDVSLISPTTPRKENPLNTNVKYYQLPRNIKFSLPLVLYKIRKILKELNPDVVHIQGVGVGVYSSSILNIRPNILTEWGLNHIEESKGIRRFLEKIAYKKADIVTVGNRTVKNILINSYSIDPDKVKILPWGTNTKVFNRNYTDQVNRLKQELKINGNSFVVIYARGMHEYWGYPYLTSAIPKVLEKNPSAIFVFMGGGSGETIKLKSRLKELGIEKNVIIIDKLVPHNEMPIYINMSDASVHLTPLDNESAALSESMACGSILIASDHEYYKHRIKDKINGFLVKRDDSDQIANIINYCIEHPEVKEEVYTNNFQPIQTTENWEYNMKKMEDIYYELIEKYKEAK